MSLWLQPVDGAAKKIHLGDVNPTQFLGLDIDVGPKGELAFAGSTRTHPSKVY